MNEDKLSQFTEQESGVKQFQSSQMQDEIQKVKEEALSSTIEGLHYPETPHQTTYKPNDQSNPYEIQTEALSRINLLDESLNPTDTYTNYINKGNSPIPGLEAQHDTLLFLDRQNEKIKEVEQGQITEEQMLWDLYGTDILEAQGYNVRSVGWWQQKYYNNDFSSPFDNQYLTSLVTEKARQYHNQLLAQKYAQTQSIENSKLAAYTKAGDLSVKQVRELFPELSTYKDYKDDDDQLMQDISSGRINANLRIHQTQTGDRYYLHTDGQLYKLTNDGGEHTAQFKQDDEGNITEININGSDVITYGRSFIAGATSVVTSLAKLVALPIGLVEGIFTSDTIVDKITDYTSAVDAWANDNVSFLADSGRVDLNGFQLTDVNDWLNTIAYTGGMIVGGKAVGAIAKASYGWGTKLADTNTMLGKISGTTLKTTANLWARSTGMYQGFGNTDAAFTLFGNVVYTGKNSMFLNHALKTVPTYAMKDFYQTLNQLQDQRISLMVSQHVNGDEVIDPTTDQSIFNHALSLTVINAAISTVFAGGVDDSPTERLQKLFEPKTIDPTARLNIAASFFKALSSPRCVVAANTTMDFIDNFLTMSMNDYITVDKDGAHWTAEGFTAGNLVKNILTAGALAKPTRDANIRRRNVGFESITTLYKDSLDSLDKTIRTNSDPEKVTQAKALRDLLVNDFKQATGKNGETDLSPEERALYALNKFHIATEDKTGRSVITDKLFKLTDEKVLAIYKEMSDNAKEYYTYMTTKTKETLKDIQTDGVKKTFTKKLLSKAASIIPTKVNRAKRANKMLNETFTQNALTQIKLETAANTYYNKYANLTRTANAQDFEDKYKEFSTIKESFDEVTEVSFKLDEKYDEAVNRAAKTLADMIEYPDETQRAEAEQQIKSNMIFYTFKNESEDRSTLNIHRATATNLAKLLPYNFIRIDDDVYAFTGLGTEIQQLFTQDAYVKVSLAADLIASNKFKEGAELYLATTLGDEDFSKVLAKDDAALVDSKDVLYRFLQDMISTKSITKLQAVKFIEELGGSDTDIGKAMQKVINSKTKVNHKNINDAEQLDPIESYLIRYNAFKILRDNDSKLGNSSVLEAERLLMDKYGNADSVTKEVFADMAQAGELSNEFFKDYNSLIVAVSKKNENFQTTSNIERLLTDIAGDKESTFDESKIDQAVSSILGKDVPKELHDEFKEKITQTLKFIQDAKLKDVDMNEDKVVLNATLFTNLGKTTLDNQLLNATTEEARNMIEKWSFDSNEKLITDIENYLKICNKVVESNNPYYVLDLNNPDDVKFLNDLNNLLHFTENTLETKQNVIDTFKNNFIEDSAKSFIIYNYGKELASDIITDEEAAKLSAYLQKERTYKKKITDRVTVFYNDGTVSDLDLYTFISNCIAPNYISKAMKAREYIKTDDEGKATLGLNPFNVKKTLDYNADVFQGTSLEEAIKTGRIGGEAAKKLKRLYSQGDYTTVNKMLSTELMLLKYVDELTSSPDKTIYLDPTTYNNMVKAGIVGDEGFYKLDSTFDRNIKKPKFYPVTLTATKEEMEYYILHEKDFNIFKILPLASKTPLNTDTRFMFPGDYEIPDVTGGVNTIPKSPIYNIFNDTFEWDNGNKLRHELITGLIENGKGLKYNPLSDRQEVLDIDNVEAYKEYRKAGKIDNETDVYYKLIGLYEAQNEIYVRDDNNEDFKLWLAHDKTLKEIVDTSETLRNLKNTDTAAYKKARTELANKIISNYESEMSGSIPEFKGYYSNQVTYNSFYSSAGLMEGDLNTSISKKTLDTLRGVGYNFVEQRADGTKGVYAGAIDDIVKAIDFVVDYDSAFLEDTFLSSSSSSRNYVAYQPNDDILLRALFAATDSKVLIQDLDELYRIRAEAYNQLFEAAMGKEGIQVAKRVKSAIDSLYERYLELNNKDIKTYLDVDKSKKFSKSRTASAATKQEYDNIVHNNGITGNQKLNDYLMDNFIKKRESSPVADIARIQDLLSDEVDSYEQAIYGNKKRFAYMYTNNPGQLEINNLSRGMNAYKVVNTIVQTSEALDRMFEEAGITGVDSMALADQLHLQSDGTRYMSEWAKYNLFNPKTNKSELGSIGKNAHGSGKDHTDVLVLLDKSDDELIGNVFFSLDKHHGDDQGALNFKYTVIKDKNDITNLRTAAILDIFNDNKYNTDFHGGYSIEGLKKLSSDKLLDILNTAINNSLLRKNVNKRIIDNLKTANISEENIYKILQDPEEYKTSYLMNNVKKTLGGELIPALQSDNPIVRQQAALIAYALHYDLMDEDSQQIVKNARDLDEASYINNHWTIRSEVDNVSYDSLPESKKIFFNKEEFDSIVNNKTLHDMDIAILTEDLKQVRMLAKALDTYYEEDSRDTINKVKAYFKDDPDGLAKMIEGYFVYGNADAGVIHYRINKDESLTDMYDKRNNAKPISEPIRLSYSTNKINSYELRNFFEEGNTDTSIKRISGIDFETTFADRPVRSIKDVWQLGLIKYVKQEDGTITQESFTKYIKHDGYESTKAWTEDSDNVDPKSPFLLNNPSVKKSLDTYKSLQEGDPDLITEEEALRLLADTDLLIAYNGESFDFKFTQEDIRKINGKIKFLDATELIKREQIDVRESAKLEDTYFNGKRKFSQDFLGKAHNAEDDVKMMMEVFVEKLNSKFNLQKDRTSLVGKFERLVDLNNPEDVHKFKQILSDVDKTIRSLKSESMFNNKFKQDTRTLDEITYTARLFNHALNTARGNLYNDLTKDLVNTSVKMNLIETDEYKEVNKVFAFVASTLGKEGQPDYYKALVSLKNAAREIAEEDEELPGSSHTLLVMSRPDERLMNKLGLSLSAYENKENNEEYKQSYGLLLGNLSKGKKVLLDPNNIFGVLPSDYQDFEDRGSLDHIAFTLQSVMQDSPDVFKNNVDLQQLWKCYMNQPLTVNESFDILDLLEYEDNRIHYKDKSLDKLVAQLENLLDEDTVASIRTQSGYKMFNSFDTHPDQLYLEIDVLNNTMKKLDNIKAGDIVITKALLDKIVSYRGYEELLGSDGNLYLYTVAYPSDNPDSLMAHRIRVINDMGDGNTSVMRFGFTPETQAILRARDFDGDFLSFFKPVSKSSVEIAAAVNKYLYNDFDVEENLASALRKMTTKKPTGLRYEAEALRLSTDSAVKKVCLEMDRALSKGNDAAVKRHMTKLKNIIRNKTNIEGKKFSEETISNIADYLGVSEKFVGEIKFVNNPAIWTDNPDEMGFYSYSQRVKYYKLRAFNMTNILDSVTGYNQKRWSKERVDIEDVTAPLVQLFSPTIRLTDTVLENIDTKLTSVKNIEEYYNVMYKAIEDNINNLGVKSGNWKRSVLEEFKTGIEWGKAEAIKILSSGNIGTQEFIKTHTYNALRTLSLTIRHNQELNNKVMDLLKGDLDNSYLEQLNRNREAMQLIKKLKGNRKKIRTIPKLDRSIEDIYLKTIINNQEDLARINLNTGSYGSIPDLLGEIKKQKNKNVDFNKYYLKSSSSVVDDHMHTADGFVFVTDDTSLLVDEDSIGVTNYAISRSAKLGVYSADLQHRYEIPEKFIKTFNKKKSAVIPAGTIIGYQQEDGYNYETPITTKRDIHLIGLERDSNNRISSLAFYYNEDLGDKKLKLPDMAKGKAKPISIDSFEIYDIDEEGSPKLGNARIDFIVNMQNAVKNTDKFGLLSNIGDSFNDMTRAAIKIGGRTITGYLVPKVDSYVVGDDSGYSTLMNTSLDPKAGNKTEVMMLGGQALSLTGIGGITGNAVVFINEDGSVTLSNKNITDLYTDSKEIGAVSYKNVAELILATRAQLLCDELGDDAMAKISEGVFKTTKEYMDNLLKSPEKINSRRLAMELLVIQNALGGKKVSRIRNKNSIAKAVFDPYFDEFVFYKAMPTDMRVSDDVSEDRIKSGNSQHIMAQRGAKQTFGEIYNPAEIGLNNNHIVQREQFYIPWNWLYKNLSGFEPNQNAIVRGSYNNNYFTVGRHYDYGGTFNNKWMPLNVNRSLINNDVTMDVSMANGAKSAVEGGTDIPTTYGLPTKLVKGSGNYNILNDFDSPLNSTVDTMVGKALNNERVYGDYKSSRQILSILDYLTKVNASTNRNRLTKMAAVKGVKGVDYDLFNMGYRTINDELVKIGDTPSGETSVNRATKEINSHAKTFWTYKDLIDKFEKANITEDNIKEMFKSGSYEDAVKFEKDKKAFNKEKDKLTAQLFENLRKETLKKGIDDISNNIRLTTNYKPTKESFEYHPMSRSGINVVGPETGKIDTALKNTYAYGEFYKHEMTVQLNELKSLVGKQGLKQFSDFAMYNMLRSAEKSDTPEMFKTRLEYVGMTMDEYKSAEKYAAYREYTRLNPQVVAAYDNFINNMVKLYTDTATVMGEPIGPTYMFFAPYVLKDVEQSKATIKNTFHNINTLNNFDPVKAGDMLKQNLMFNFFEGSEKIINEISQLRALEELSNTLTGALPYSEAMIDNKSIVDKAYEILNTDELLSSVYAGKEFDVTPDILNIISLYTDIDYYSASKKIANTGQLLLEAFNQVTKKVDKAMADYTFETGEHKSLSDVWSDANNERLNQDTRAEAKELYNKMWSQIILAQRIMEVDGHAMDKFADYVDSLSANGKVLVNKFGQIISMDTPVRPLMSSSLRYLKDNVEISLNNMNKKTFAQFVMEKALSGEIYIADADMAKQLENNVFTTKVGGRVWRTLKKISKVSAGIQMSLPTKMLGRLLRFTGFDYVLDAMANPKSIPYMSVAAREIAQAMQTNGKVMSDELKGYLMREGQPSIGKGSGKDPINFTEEMAITEFTNKLTRPLEIQNHLGRYAIYLTAKKSFDEGNPWYGPLYHKKEAIDALPTNEDKAMYIMDYLLGSPGGFPAITKKTSGLMMYATFPMNFTRTMGAYGMSLSRLFKEGITDENKKYWMDTAVIPSAMGVGISYLGAAIVSAICEMFGVDEETEERWKNEGVWIDPLGTLLGGTPSVVFDSINPVYTAKEMFINPWTNEYNETLPEKAYGFVQSNFLSKLNPAIKNPAEIILRKELYGDTVDNISKYQYTNLENGMRKVLGFFVGSGVANAVIDEHKMNAYNDSDTSFAGELWKGLTKGISADLGNQKSYKQNTSNYYAVISNMRKFKNATNGKDALYDYEVSDLLDANSLYYSRNYSNKYGVYNEDDYKRINNLMKKMIKDNRSASEIYALIVEEFNNGTSEATLRSVLNSNSIVRRLNSASFNKAKYFESLNDKELARVRKAIEYEMAMYPLLSKFFPEQENSNSVYIPKYQRIYNSKGSSSGYPKASGYTPRTYPGRYYPKTFYYNKKTGGYSGNNINRVSVNVSPQMAIWNQDYNLTRYDSGLTAKNEPKWLRDKGYVNRTN